MAKSTVAESVDNIFWAYLSFFSTKVLNLAAIVILARYLTPAEFGLMAICLAVIGYFEIMSQFGMGAALISARERVEEVASAVLLCGLATSLALALLLWQAAGPIARAYGEPALAELLAVIALALVVRATTAVNMSFLFRELRLRDKLMPDIVRGLVKGGVGIALAIAGLGVWALVWGYLAGSVAASLTLAFVRPWRPSVRPGPDTIVWVLRFGSHLILTETINATPRLLDNLLVGKVLGAAALGIYSLAFRIPELGIKTFTNVAGTVLHPMMSKIQGDADALLAYYYGALRYCALLMFGCGAAIAVLADPLVRVLYSPQWYGMIVPMQLLSAAFAIGTLNMVPGNALKALSRTGLMARASLINLPFFVAAIWLAVPYGIEAVALAQVAVAAFRFVPVYVMLRRAIPVTVARTAATLVPGLVCAGAGTVAAILAQRLATGGPLPDLTAGTLAFALAWVAVARLVSPEAYAELSGLVAGKLRARRVRRRAG